MLTDAPLQRVAAGLYGSIELRQFYQRSDWCVKTKRVPPRPDAEKEIIPMTKTKPVEEDEITSLFEQYGRRVFNLAFKMVGNREDAEEITQDTFIGVYNNIHRFEGRSHISTWIYRIAKNHCYRLLKNRQRGSFTSLEELIREAHIDEEPSAYSQMERLHLAQQVREGCLIGLLKCLSLNQRTAFIFGPLLGLSIAATAGILDKTEGATKVLIHRARRNLKAFLCKNCSLFKPGNPCRCEGLVQFSLKQGWIQKRGKAASVGETIPDAEKIAKEIGSISKITRLYNSLDEGDLSEIIKHNIREVIHTQPSTLFSK